MVDPNDEPVKPRRRGPAKKARICKNGHNLDETGRIGHHCRLCRLAWQASPAQKAKRHEYETTKRTRDVEAERARGRLKNHRQRGLIGVPDESTIPAVCPECERPPKPGKRLEADHDHTTGLFRGWLCHSCNTTLGYCADDPELLRRLATYLERSRP